ncbi:DUF4276 family protein [Sorangium sp. So ce513]|uniref:DUF4276 family protein n=1 Tax=Sorangium sp. So ce513 TaxID=3133315 RepID=UPI003F6438F6
MKRLVCIVEGKGEVTAIPNLCSRVIRHYLGIQDWVVDNDPIRQPRGMLVDQKAKSPLRPCNTQGVRRALALAKARRADAVLVLCDADDDCPAKWGPHATELIKTVIAGAAVMVLREYETWILLNYSDDQLRRANVPAPEKVSGAKEKLRRLVPDYSPSEHQLIETRRIDIARLRARSDSFDKLVRALSALCGAMPPARELDSSPLARRT